MGADDSAIYLVIALTFFGFLGLAFILLFPVYRFLRREEREAETWTQDSIARRQRRGPGSGDGAPPAPPPRRPPPRPPGP